MTPVYTYQCPRCRKLFRWGEPFEPMCTGPSEMRHDHAPVLMRRYATAEDRTRPDLAARLAARPLIIGA